MGTTITQARVFETAALVRCDLARARRRAGLTLARVHADDEVWRASLSRDYYQGAQQKWAEFLGLKGEERAVARYEFLAEFDAWIHAFGGLEKANSGDADVHIVGMFGTDAIIVSRPAGLQGRRGRPGKLYRLLRNEEDAGLFSSLLRLPRTEAMYVPGGREAIDLSTNDESADRLVCGYDTLLVIARVGFGRVVRYRIVPPGERLLISPGSLDGISSQFVDTDHLLSQAKAALRKMDPALEVKPKPDTRLFRCTPSGMKAEAEGIPTDMVGPTPKTTGRTPVEDLLVRSNQALVEPSSPGTSRPSITTALRLSAATVALFSPDVFAVESDATEIVDPPAETMVAPGK